MSGRGIYARSKQGHVPDVGGALDAGRRLEAGYFVPLFAEFGILASFVILLAMSVLEHGLLFALRRPLTLFECSKLIGRSETQCPEE